MAQMDKRILKSIEKLDSASLSKLLSSGVSTQGVDKKGNTFLHLAAISNSIELCGILIAGGCDPLCRNKNGMTASEVADKKKKKKAATYLKEQEIKFATNLKSSSSSQIQPPTSQSQQPQTPKSSGGESNPYPNLKSTSATVNIFCYDYNIQDWQQVLSEATLTVEFVPNPFGFYLIASNSAQTTINDPISSETVFSKSTDSFYNYRLGEGEVYGFQFIDHLDEFCTAITDAKHYVENPPAPVVEPTPEPVHVEAPPPPAPPAPAVPQGGGAPPAPPAPPAPAGGSGGPPAPPPPSGGPPPPPPPPPPAAPAGGGKALSLAEQLALKKQKLNETGTSDPAGSTSAGGPTGGAPAAAPVSAPSSGGGMMSELQLRLQKRQSVGAQPKLDHSQGTQTEAAPVQPAAAPSAEVPKSVSVVKPPAANPLKSSAVPPAAKKVNPPSAAPSSTDTHVVSSSDSHHAAPGYSKQDIEAFKNAMIEGFKAELQQIKEDIIYSIRQEISAYVN